MGRYDERRLFRVTLQHVRQPEPETAAPVFTAIISAFDDADARREADKLADTLNGLVSVVDVAEKGVGTLPSIRL